MFFIVPPTYQPIKIRDFLRGYCQISLTHWRRIKRHDLMRINGTTATPSAFVRSGDIVEIRNLPSPNLIPTDMPLTILYEDAQFLAVFKPAGMLVHPVNNEQTGSLANLIQHYYLQQGEDCAFHPILRLDRNTSGIVLIAKSSLAHRLMGQNPPDKIYLAICAGIPVPPSGIIDAPIAREPGSIVKRRVDDSGQPAKTKYKTLRTRDNSSLVVLKLLTGRTHQIRAHLSHISCPLFGDDLYGGPKDRLQRQALHACRLSFLQPFTHKAIDILCPLPHDLHTLLTNLGYTNSVDTIICDIIKGDIDIKD